MFRFNPLSSGRLSLDLRECYEKDGELKPGKKGIALTPDQWAALREGSGRVTERLLAKLGGSWPAGVAAKQGKQPGEAGDGWRGQHTTKRHVGA